MTRTSILATLAATAGLLLFSGTAHAGSVAVDGDAVVFAGAPGEANQILVAARPGGVRITDLNGPITGVGAGCTAAGEQEVDCPAAARVRIDLADANDSVDIAEGAPATQLLGGAGDDRLDGAAGPDELRGGPGNDTLSGHAGDDALYGEDGDDTLSGDAGKAPGNDVIDGGAGIDTADDWVQSGLSAWPAANVSLDGAADDGRPGEADNVVGIEKATMHVSGRFVLSDAAEEWQAWGNVDGGASVVEARGGNDVITGEGRQETIDGGAGDDRLEGGNGDDTIVGGPGRDTVYGDDTATTCVGGIENCVVFGNDTIDVRDGERDSVDCGPGTDRVTADAVDVLAGCETVETDRPQQPSVGTPRAALVKVGLRTALRKGFVVRLTGAAPGKVTLKAKRGKRLVAKGSGTVRPDGAARVRLRFTKAGKRRLARARTAKLTVSGGGARLRVTLRR